MKLRTLLLLALVAFGLVVLVLWALDRPGGYAHVASPALAHQQLALWVDGPSPNIRIELFTFNTITRGRAVLLLLTAPMWACSCRWAASAWSCSPSHQKHYKARQTVLRRAGRG